MRGDFGTVAGEGGGGDPRPYLKNLDETATTETPVVEK